MYQIMKDKAGLSELLLLSNVDDWVVFLVSREILGKTNPFFEVLEAVDVKEHMLARQTTLPTRVSQAFLGRLQIVSRRDRWLEGALG